MDELTPKQTDPTAAQELIKSVLMWLTALLTLLFSFSEKGLNILEKIRKLKSSKAEREERIEQVAETMEKVIARMADISNQQHEAAFNMRMYLKQAESNESDISEMQKTIAEMQQQIAYIRGKTETK